MADIVDKIIKTVDEEIPKLPQTLLSGEVEIETRRHVTKFNDQNYEIVNTPNKIKDGELHWTCTATNSNEPDIVGTSDEFVSPDQSEKAAIKDAETLRLDKSQANAELVILLISADPQGGSVNVKDMQMEVEKQVQDNLGAEAMKRFKFVMKLSVSPKELIDLIGQFKPHILHFFGHSGEDGIGLRDPDHSDKFHTVSADALKPTLSLEAAKTIKLLLLTGCSNASVAQDLAEKSEVDYVIGTTAEINNEQAILFAAQFYTVLVQGKTIWESCNSGQAQLALMNLAGAFHVKSKRTKQEDEALQNVKSILWRA